MEVTSTADASSPLATVEEIQNRLIRPPPLLSQSSTSSTRPRDYFTSFYSTPFDVINSIEFQRKRDANYERKVTNRRLEDYLDPSLLAATRAKIGGNRKRGGEIVLKESEFEWPVNELKVWTENLRSEKGKVMKWRSDKEAVHLGDDADAIRGGGDDDDGGGRYCSPFQRFERTALKRFKG